MKVETRKEMKEVLIDIFIADDGTEFKDINECSEYENDLKNEKLEKKFEKFEIKELSGVPPLDTKASYIEGDNDFKWFKVNNKEDVDLIDEVYRDGAVEPKQYPDVICVEYREQGCCCEGWSYFLSEMKEETIEFWKKFGLKVNFEEVKDND